MKAIVYTQYGPPEVLQLKEIEQPVPKDNEIRVKVRATCVSSGDWRLRKAEPFLVRLFFGLIKPRINILGVVFSGEIDAVGKAVTQFKIGDAVFGSTEKRFGTYAEYISLPENGVVALKPDVITHEEAAAIPFGGNTALYFLRKANIQPGQKVLIYGASGAIGVVAIQLAKHYGAEVTGVSSTANVDLLKSLGADRVIDYTQEDFSQGDTRYDVIFETVGKCSLSNCVRSLKQDGYLLLAAAMVSAMFQSLWLSMSSSINIISGEMRETADDMLIIKELLEAGKIKPVIDRCYPLEEIAEAHRYVEKGHKKGNVIITL